MKAIHGGKAKNDKIDSHKIAGLMRGGMFPLAYRQYDMERPDPVDSLMLNCRINLLAIYRVIE